MLAGNNSQPLGENMAFLIKGNNKTSTGRAGFPFVRQLIHVPRATQNTHNVGVASSTYGIYNVVGGKVAVYHFHGTVTTLIQTQACNLSVNFDATVGAAVVLASTLDITARDVGVTFDIHGLGSAVVASGTTTIGGFVLASTAARAMVLAPGVINQILSADNTGSIKWDLWYEPLEEGAYVTATQLNTVLGA